MRDAEVRAVSLFFYFSFLDGRKAYELTPVALSRMESAHRKQPQLSRSSVLVRESNYVWSQSNHEFKEYRGRSSSSLASGWTTPFNFDVESWKQFCKQAPSEELLVVLWSQALQISDEDIAAGLGISTGTVRFRLSHGLRRLGSMLQSGKVIHV